MMEKKSIRVNNKTYEILRKQAANAGTTMTAILEEAVREYDKRRFWEEHDRGYAALRADPKAWEEYQNEMALWDSTLMDGLEDFPYEQDQER
jgi:hypothetical protein